MQLYITLQNDLMCRNSNTFYKKLSIDYVYLQAYLISVHICSLIMDDAGIKHMFHVGDRNVDEWMHLKSKTVDGRSPQV